jgi:hypothetical protein
MRTTRKNSPPSAALWLIRCLYGGSDGEALAGDMVERFTEEDRTIGWFWRQTGVAIAAGLPGAARNRWPELTYAIGAFALHAFLWLPAKELADRLPWGILPWPASQLAMEHGPTLVMNAAALVGLGLTLRIAGRFLWSSLTKTALLAAAFTFTAVILRLAAYGPPPPNSYWLLLELPFISFLMAAMLGCRADVAKRSLAP